MQFVMPHGAFLPNNPPFDKVAALYTAEVLLGVDLPISGFCDNPALSAEDLLAMYHNGTLPIDLGPTKYNKGGDARSATEFIAKLTGRPLPPGITELVRLAGENNKTGMLRNFHRSMVKDMRMAYQLGCDRREVIERVEFVIHCFVQVMDCGLAVKYSRDEEFEMQFQGLLEILKNCNYALFTPQSLLWHMWQLRYRWEGSGMLTIERMRGEINFWLDVHDRVKPAQEDAKRWWEENKGDLTTFGVCDGLTRMKGLVVYTDSQFVTNEVSRHADVTLARNSRGHLAVLTNHLDVTRLFVALKELDPPELRWGPKKDGSYWHMAEGGHIIWGGAIYTGAPACPHSDEVIMECIKRNPPIRQQANRERR